MEEESNSPLPPILLLTFQKKCWTILVTKDTTGSSFLSRLTFLQFGIVPAVSVAEVAVRPIICHHFVAVQMEKDSEEELYPTCSTARRHYHVTWLCFLSTSYSYADLLYVGHENIRDILKLQQRARLYYWYLYSGFKVFLWMLHPQNSSSALTQKFSVM